MELRELISDQTLWNLLIRFFVNLVVLFVLIGLIYYRFSKKAEFFFSFIIMGIMIFLVCSILGTVNLQIGYVVGLFAIFAILRFRTVQYSVKDITYVFVIIGVSVINSQAKLEPFILGAVIINSSIVLLVYFFELFLKGNKLEKATVSYSRLDLLKPELRKDLLADLSLETGLRIEKISIKEIDIRKKTAEIEIFFKDL
jgi:hypothetical protein